MLPGPPGPPSPPSSPSPLGSPSLTNVTPLLQVIINCSTHWAPLA